MGANNIPLALRERPQWVVWEEQLRDGNWTKPPGGVRGGPASTTDASTWGSFDDAVARVDGVLNRPDRGIGFVVCKDDPFLPVDLDSFRSVASGDLTAEADDIVYELDSYAEVSPSGNGIHVWIEASLNGRRNRTGNFEAYDHGRFMTITVLKLDGVPDEILPRQQAFDRLYARVFGPDPEPQPVRSEQPPVTDDDHELLSWALAGRSDDKLKKLLEGDISGYESQSEAELALLGMLRSFAGDNPERLDKLYRLSGLFRPKWDQRRGQLTYGERTLKKALAGTRGSLLDPPSDTQDEGGGQAENNGPPFKIRTMAQMMREAPESPEWVLEGYVAPATQVLLWGPPKVGKSTLLFRLLGAFGKGGTVLGLDAERVSYMLLSEESHNTLAEKAFTLRTDDDNSDVVMFADTRGTPWADVVRHCVECCKQRGHRLLVIDTLARWGGLAGETENHAGAVMKVLEPLVEAQEAGMAVLVVHHARKGGGKHGEGARGSSAFVGAVDVSLELARWSGVSDDDPRRVLRALSRFSETPAELGMRLEGDDYSLVDVDAETAGELAELDKSLLEFLGDSAKTREAIMAELGTSKATVAKHLRKLERWQLVVRHGRGVKDNPYMYRRAEDTA
jgi:putative DNA primase/helicase